MVWVPSLLKGALEPTDFADADCRVTEWVDFKQQTTDAYRIWICKCGKGYWFQRHEWSKPGRNSTEMDEWLFVGYSPYRTFPPNMTEAPALD